MLDWHASACFGIEKHMHDYETVLKALFIQLTWTIMVSIYSMYNHTQAYLSNTTMYSSFYFIVR